MADELAANTLHWLATYALHSSLFLGGAWLLQLLRPRLSPMLLGAAWRVAVMAGVLTASLQTAGVLQPVTATLPVSFVRPTPAADFTAAESTNGVLLPNTNSRPTASQPMSAPPASIPNDRGPVGALAANQLDWRHALLIAWASGTAILVLRMLFGWLAARRMLADRSPIVRGELFDRIQVIAQEVGLRRLPQVSLSDRIPGPFTLPSGEICIPVWAREKFPQHQLDAMLAHEMAHTLRHDSLWLTIASVIEAVFFFQPLNGLARRRIALLAELCADDWAASRAGEGRSLAECLSEFAELTQKASVPTFAAAILRPKSSLVQRVERLLDGRYSNGVLTMKSKLAIGLVAASLGVLLPGFAAQALELPSHFEPHRSVQRGDNSLSASIATATYSLDMQSRGDVHLAPDGSGVVRISNGGSLDISFTREGVFSQIRFAGDRGAVAREYSINGKRRPWNKDADALVRELMPVVLRESGFDADARTDWLLANKGSPALLREIGLIDSDTIQRRYVVRYTQTAKLSSDDLRELTAILKVSLQSDSTLRDLLERILETQQPIGDDLMSLIDAGDSIESDSELRRLLQAVAPSIGSSAPLAEAFIRAVATIQSDGERAGSLQALADKAELGASSWKRWIEKAALISSASTKSSLLTRAAGKLPRQPELLLAYRDAARSISSRSERERAERALR